MMQLNRSRYMAAAWMLGFLWFLCPARAQESPAPNTQNLTPNTQPVETYRLRVENSIYGRIEASVDGGAHYILIGRVLRPAATAAPDRTADKPGLVLRASGEGLAFTVAPNQILKLLPAQEGGRQEQGKGKREKGKEVGIRHKAQGTREKGKGESLTPSSAEPGALRTDLEPEKDLFGDLLPPKGTAVRLQIGTRTIGAFPEGYTPGQEDVFLFLVSLPLPGSTAVVNAPSEAQQRKDQQEEIGKRLEALNKAYQETALARATAARRPIVSGILTLRAKLPAGEPEPITAATFAVDGDVVAAQNIMPFSYGWDTRRVPDGEHVVEIRALSQYATIISRVRALVFVQNTSPTDKL